MALIKSFSVNEENSSSELISVGGIHKQTLVKIMFGDIKYFPCFLSLCKMDSKFIHMWCQLLADIISTKIITTFKYCQVDVELSFYTIKMVWAIKDNLSDEHLQQ